MLVYDMLIKETKVATFKQRWITPKESVNHINGSSFSFFFKAEDGIRDLTVTGVQTCALPISTRQRRRDRNVIEHDDRAATEIFIGQRLGLTGDGLESRRFSNRERARQKEIGAARRSEERRVGKEWRSRGSRCQEKTKTSTGHR